MTKKNALKANKVAMVFLILGLSTIIFPLVYDDCNRI